MITDKQKIGDWGEINRIKLFFKSIPFLLHLRYTLLLGSRH